jgi:WD40 repeat protein
MLRQLCILILATLVIPFITRAQTLKEIEKSQINPQTPSGIWTIDWSPDDKYFALGGEDSVLWIYKANGPELYKRYKMKNMVRCVSWHPLGKYLAISIRDSDAQLLNIETEQVIDLTGIKYGARGIAWNYNGNLLATADNAGIVMIWNKEGKLLRSIKKENINSYSSIDWHPSKNILVTGGDEIRIYDTTGKLLKNIKHRQGNIYVLTVKWHPSGSFFASGDYGHAEEGDKASIIQFWKEDGTIIKTLYGSKAEYRNIRWNKDGSLLASASDAMRIWTREGELISTGPSEAKLWGIDWNSKSNLIITTTSNNKIRLWTNKFEPVK